MRIIRRKYAPQELVRRIEDEVNLLEEKSTLESGQLKRTQRVLMLLAALSILLEEQQESEKDTDTAGASDSDAGGGT